MTIFEISMINNLKQMHSIMLNRGHLQKQDRDMLLIEIIICTIIISPNTITYIWKSPGVNVLETKEHQQIDAFAYYIVRLFLLYMDNTFSFLVCILTSQHPPNNTGTIIIFWATL